MLSVRVSTANDLPRIQQLIKMSFLNNSKDFDKINNGKRFLCWIVCVNEDDEIVATTSIFSRDVNYKMGLFCVHPKHRGKGIGKYFYNKVLEMYSPLEWTAITRESVMFYRRLKCVERGGEYRNDGKYHITFTSH